MTRIHVSPLDWEGAGSPSVGASCPAVTVPPSKRDAVSAAQGQGAGLPEGFGRAGTANRHPPSVVLGCCPGRRWLWPPRIARGPSGPRGHAPSPCRGHGRVSRGPMWPRFATQVVPGRGIAGYGAPRPPSGAAVTRAPLEELTRGRGGTQRRRWSRRGAPASVRGGEVAGEGHAGHAAGARGMAFCPSGAAVTRAPLGESSREGAERRRGRRWGAPASVRWPKKTGQAGPAGFGRGGRRLRAVRVPPLPPKMRVSADPHLFSLVGPAFLLGCGGHGVPAVDGYHADGGYDVPKG